MARDPKGRTSNDGAHSESSPGLVPEQVGDPDTKHNASDTGWLSMTTPDPAFFLKDPPPTP